MESLALLSALVILGRLMFIVGVVSVVILLIQAGVTR